MMLGTATLRDNALGREPPQGDQQMRRGLASARRARLGNESPDKITIPLSAPRQAIAALQLGTSR